MTGYRVVVVGATGAVGRTILSILAQSKVPIASLRALASARSAGTTLLFGTQEIVVEDLAKYDFAGTQIALFSPGASVSKIYAPIAAKAGCWVVDNTSYFRYMDHIPLVVSEVNPHHLERAHDRIIANPNCSTMQMMVALKPIMDCVGITRINVASYQSVSGSGNQAIVELDNQIELVRQGRSLGKEDCRVYPRPIAYNAIPHIDVFQDNGYTKEEMKMVWETQKIFDSPVAVNPTCVRVPVKVGHGLAVHLETSKPLSVADAITAMQQQSGLVVHPEQENYPTALEHCAGKDAVHVGRIRKDISHPQGLNMWIVADNLRKGAALNAVQIAELLVERGMISV